MSVRIEYGAVSIGAREAFEVSAQGISNISKENEIKTEGLMFENLGNPCDPYSVLLDGSVIPLQEDKAIGIWSDELSDDEGVLANPIVLTLQADGLFSANGISFDFDKYNNIYCTDLTIEWYNDSGMVESADFQPNASAYFCSKKVEYFNKIVVTMRSINMPRARLKLRSIEYGVKVVFEGRDLRNATVTQESDTISSKLPIGKLDLVVETGDNLEYLFQERQRLRAFFNENLVYTTFIKNAERQSRKTWKISAEDYIGLLEDTTFSGGIYEDKSAYDLIAEIFNAAKIPFSVHESLKDVYVDGYIPFGNCRDALKQVLFSVGAIVKTGYSDLVVVDIIDQTVKDEISIDRIMQGAKETRKKSATSVEIVSHRYKPTEETKTAYEAKNDGYGQGIIIQFSEPLHSLEIVNGEILYSGSNYAIINAREDCVLTGKKYEHLKFLNSKKNPLVLASESENIVSVKDATLISPWNVDKILDLCYNYYVNNGTYEAKIVERKGKPRRDTKYGMGRYGAFTYGFIHEEEADESLKVGDIVKCQKGYGDSFKGIIEKQTFSLNGNTLVKKTTLKQV